MSGQPKRGYYVAFVCGGKPETLRLRDCIEYEGMNAYQVACRLGKYIDGCSAVELHDSALAPATPVKRREVG